MSKAILIRIHNNGGDNNRLIISTPPGFDNEQIARILKSCSDAIREDIDDIYYNHNTGDLRYNHIVGDSEYSNPEDHEKARIMQLVLRYNEHELSDSMIMGINELVARGMDIEDAIKYWCDSGGEI